MSDIMLFDPVIAPIILAFIFVFAVVYGLLSSSKVLEFKRPVNAAIAVVFAGFSASYEPFVVMIQDIMPVASIFLIIIFFIVFVKKNLFKEKKDGEKSESSDLLHLGVSMALLLVVLGSMGDILVQYLPAGIDASSVLWIAGILIILILFWIGYKKGFS